MKKILTGVGAVLTGTLLTQFAAHATPSLLDTTTYGGDTFSLYQGDATTDTGADAWSNAEAFAAAHG